MKQQDGNLRGRGGDGVVVRPTARVITLSPGGRVLLFSAIFPDESTGKRFWFPPGGGVEDGESHEQAAQRELREETGLLLTIGPCLWLRDHTWHHTLRNRWVRSVERYYIAHSDTEALLDVDAADGEMQEIAERRWWSLHDIQASEDVFAPRRLSFLLADLLRGAIPAQPLAVE